MWVMAQRHQSTKSLHAFHKTLQFTNIFDILDGGDGTPLDRDKKTGLKNQFCSQIHAHNDHVYVLTEN